MIWETMAKTQLLEVELKRLNVLLDMIHEGDFEWYPKLCPVCIKATALTIQAGQTITRCAICSSIGISARCFSIDVAYCNRKADNDEFTDEDIEFFVHLFTIYIMNVKEELVKLK